MRLTVAALLFLMACLPAPAQYGRRSAGRSTAGRAGNPTPIKGVYITFHGKLKDLTKKSILLEDDKGQIMTFRRDKKTKFTEGDTAIKSSDIDLESLVTVNASEDNDLKLIAASVVLDPNQKKKEPKAR